MEELDINTHIHTFVHICKMHFCNAMREVVTLRRTAQQENMGAEIGRHLRCTFFTTDGKYKYS